MVRREFWLTAMLLAGACSSPKEEAKVAPVPTLHEMMTRKIDVEADKIWAIGNAAIDDSASLDPAKMTARSWQELQESSERMAAHAKELSALNPVVVTRQGVKIADEGTPGAPSPAAIQGHIARDPAVYRSLADALMVHAVSLADAAKLKDAPKAGALLNGLDGVCETCHLEFWYPEQKAFVEAVEAKNHDPR
ncbi:MAG: hypothetical protein JWL91_455 [Sphingomonas bacterium]|jgi:hypothetical protein|nr:hypothetical protein [Sphingomonas bacterium]